MDLPISKNICCHIITYYKKGGHRASRAPPVQFINLKSYDEDCLLRQCFTISTTTNKTVTQTQVKPFCLSKVDSFLSFMILTVFPHGYRKWFPCRLSPPYSLWL